MSLGARFRQCRQEASHPGHALQNTLTAVMNGLGDHGLQGQGEGAVASPKERREAQADNTQIHDFLQLLGLLL